MGPHGLLNMHASGFRHMCNIIIACAHTYVACRCVYTYTYQMSGSELQPRRLELMNVHSKNAAITDLTM